MAIFSFDQDFDAARRWIFALSQVLTFRFAWENSSAT